MNNELFIHSFEPVLPVHHLPQSKTVEWILQAHRRTENLINESSPKIKTDEQLKHFTLDEKYISNRYFEIDDVDENWGDHRIYRLNKETPHGATIGERNHFFAEKVRRVFEVLYGNKTPHHMIHVTCTGYLSPSPGQKFFSEQGKSPDITHAYHMGCYASIPSVRMAMGLALSEKNEIDIVHNELCSLHLNSSIHTPEQMVVQTLFADGHIRYVVGLENKEGMKILAVMEKMVPDTQNHMTWIPDAFGMMMTLSREVPIRIRDALPAFVMELCKKANVSAEEIHNEAIFAIHPGGPKIIEAVQKKLELRDDQIEMSRKVLFERGNMSSATLPHVWNEIIKSRPPKKTKVLSLAFGPGLTIFGSIFEVVA